MLVRRPRPATATTENPHVPDAFMSEPLRWSVPASAGEFVQGVWKGRWLQVAAPINRVRWSEVAQRGPFERPSSAHAPALGDRGWHAVSPSAHGVHPSWRKVKAGLARVAEGWTGPVPAMAVGGDRLHRGAGMGSSTADLAAASAALAAALGAESPEDVAIETCLSVEPTNGTVLPGLVLFDHRRGAVREPLGPHPSLDLVICRPPGAVDTQRFNRRLPRRLPAVAVEGWRRAFELCATAIRLGDLEGLARAARSSAELARHLGAPPAPPPIVRAAEATSALGWLRAHSGTVWSLMYPPGERPDPAAIRGIWQLAGRPVEVMAATLHATGIVSSPVLPSPWDVIMLPPEERGRTEDRSNAGAAPPL